MSAASSDSEPSNDDFRTVAYVYGKNEEQRDIHIWAPCGIGRGTEAQMDLLAGTVLITSPPRQVSLLAERMVTEYRGVE